MSSSYTPQDALDFAKSFVHGIPIDSIGPQAVDQANSVIWRAAFWRWTIKALTPFSLSNGVQDYSNKIPSDFYRWRLLQLVRTDVSPNQFRELNQKEYIGVELSRLGSIDTITSFCNQPELSGIRFELPPSISGTLTLQCQAQYQYEPTKIDSGQILTAFAFPDQYFNVIADGTLWRLYALSDDPRAGTVTTDNFGRKQYSGKLAEFMASLDNMKQAENTGYGETSFFPQDPLGGYTRGVNPGLFGYS